MVTNEKWKHPSAMQLSGRHSKNTGTFNLFINPLIFIFTHQTFHFLSFNYDLLFIYSYMFNEMMSDECWQGRQHASIDQLRRYAEHNHIRYSDDVAVFKMNGLHGFIGCNVSRRRFICGPEARADIFMQYHFRPMHAYSVRRKFWYRRNVRSLISKLIFTVASKLLYTVCLTWLVRATAMFVLCVHRAFE